MSNSRLTEDPLCVCGHERHLHANEPCGLCIKDEWCQCPGYTPRADDERYEQIMQEWAVGRLAP